MPLFSLASDVNVVSNPAALGFGYGALVTPLSTSVTGRNGKRVDDLLSDD
jgi:hypothetical protein